MVKLKTRKVATKITLLRRNKMRKVRLLKMSSSVVARPFVVLLSPLLLSGTAASARSLLDDEVYVVTDQTTITKDEMTDMQYRKSKIKEK